jgi:antitoxin (DNA-binding transcriptional repressor) of toxin-antitoxin stability system
MTVTLIQAQADLVGLIRRLSPGEEVVITENERTVARLKAEPTSPPQRPGPGLLKGMITIVEDDDEHLKDFAEYMQ